jgi:hypothetical protein
MRTGAARMADLWHDRSVSRSLALLALTSVVAGLSCAKGAGSENDDAGGTPAPTVDAGRHNTSPTGGTGIPTPPAPRVDAGRTPTSDAGRADADGSLGDAALEGGMDGSVDASADAAADAGGDAGGGGGTCFGDALNFDATGAGLAFTAAVDLNCSPTINTALAVGAMLTGWCGPTPTPVVQTQTVGGGPSIVVVPMASFTLQAGQTLRLVGDKPVVLAVAGDADIAGTIDASSDATNNGAGYNWSCGGSQGGAGGGGNCEPAGGGGGGFGTAGGLGGAGSGTASGAVGTARANLTLAPLVGGCAGGTGGNCSGCGSCTAGGAGGAGGGAVQISATGSLTVTGTLKANGKAGTKPGDAGSGGGGSGGGLLLEGATVSTGGATITANGGDGGGGESCGAGGVGSTSAGSPGGNGCSNSKNGAGAGGGYGVVIERTLTIPGSC